MFNAKNLRPLADNVTSSVVPVVWSYYNADNDTVTTAGYIPTGYNVKDKDQVMVIKSDGSGHSWYHATVADNVITLAAVSA